MLDPLVQAILVQEMLGITTEDSDLAGSLEFQEANHAGFLLLEAE